MKPLSNQPTDSSFRDGRPNTRFLAVGEGHHLWIEHRGPMSGQPIVLLHGGPGAGHGVDPPELFDPAATWLIRFDQRGAGRSLPHGETAKNTTDRLVADIDRVRQAVGVSRWLVAGQSFGAFLAVAYGRHHPEACAGLLLCAPLNPDAATGSYDALFAPIIREQPEAWAELVRAIGLPDGTVPVEALHALVDRSRSADRDWRLGMLLNFLDKAGEGFTRSPPNFPIEASVRFACILSWYLRNDLFLDRIDWHRTECSRGLPVEIVHGTSDLICPPSHACRFASEFDSAGLTIVPGAGHSLGDPALLAASRTAADRLIARLAGTESGH